MQRIASEVQTGWTRSVLGRAHASHAARFVLAAFFVIAASVVDARTDKQAPRVSVVSPATGSTVSGIVTIDVAAVDHVGVARVDVFVNSVFVGTRSVTPYSYAWNSAGVANGSATVAAYAYDAAGNVGSSSRTVTVANGTVPVDSQPPSVAVTAPTAGSTLRGTVPVNVSASDAGGVARVDLFANGTLAGRITSAPFAFSWNSTSVADGAVTLTATAYDPSGNSASSSVTATVSNAVVDTQAPTVAIGSPAAGATVGGTVQVNVSASDNVAVARVELRANGTMVGTSTAAPYSFSWNTTGVPNGNASLSAMAVDAAGNSASAASNVTVSNAITTPGMAALTIGAANAPAGVTVRVHPRDAGGSGDGTAGMTRTYAPGTRVWLSAPLRSGNNYFVKWQKDGVDFDTAATTSLVADTNHSISAVYETPSCSGVAVYPGTDSLKQAVAAYPAGTTFCVKAGVHRFTSSVAARHYDKYVGEPGSILNGSKVVGGFTPQGAYWVANPQVVRQPAMPSTIGGYPTCAAASAACIYPEKAFLDGAELTQAASLGALGAGQFYFDYGTGLVYLVDNPTGRTVEVTTGSGGIVGYSSGTNVTVKNLVFEKFGGGDVAGSGNAALKVGDGWIVQNSEFRYISLAAVMNSATGVVRNSFIHHNGQYGVIGAGRFEGNTISHNNADGFNTGNGAGASKFTSVTGLVARGNTIASHVGRGLWTDYDNVNTTYENNVIENNTEMGIFHEVSCSAVIRYNVLRGNNSYEGPWVSLWYGGQIFLRGSKDVQIYGNDIDASGPGANAVSLRDDSTSYTAAKCGATQLRNVSVSDNVIRLDSQDFNGIATGTGGYHTANNLLFLRNSYFMRDTSARSFAVDATSATFLNRGEWQAAGQDATATFTAY